MRAIWFSAAASIFLTGGALAQTQDLASPRFGAWGFDLSGMDHTVRPGDDFYRFANGKWDEVTPIPPDKSRYGNFDRLSDLSEARAHAIYEDAVAGRLNDPDAAKIATAYSAFMDEAQAERLGDQPIRAELDEIAAARTKADFALLMARATHTDFRSIFPVYISTDSKEPTRYAVYASTGGMGLPDRDYYLEASFADKKAKYEAYVADMLSLIGWPGPQENARAVVAFETRLAEASWPRSERRDLDKTYNPMTRAELDALTPGIDWSVYLNAAGLPDIDRVVVVTNTAFPKFSEAYAETPLEVLKAWQAFHLTDSAAPYLSSRFVEASFAFNDKELSGQEELQERWKRAAYWMDGAIGESVGRVYVAKYFSPDAKAKIDSLVEEIRAALRTRIDKLEWMDAETRVRAQEKLAKFTVKIGHPSAWRDYGALTFTRDSAYQNDIAVQTFDWRYQVDRLFQPVDKSEWGMPPQMANAYYDPSNNEVVFPAAILQPPFFDPEADPAINYGGIGAAIGHEITHGFDDQGRKSDGDGALSDWWTNGDAARFKRQAERLGAQYSRFEVLPGVHVQGELTMGENIGDLGGLSLALDAYRASLKGAPAPVLDGLTGDQRVFLGWAQIWREKARDDALRNMVVTNPHAPTEFRVDGTIRNIDGWYTAWDVKPTDRLYVAPADRVRIW